MDPVDAPKLTLLPNDGLHFGAFLAQQIAVPMAGMVASGTISGMLYAPVRDQSLAPTMENACCLAAAALAGSGLGYASRRWLPRLRSTGRWICALPCLALGWALIGEISSFGLVQALQDVFFPGVGKAEFALLLATCPVVCSASFSAVLARR